jgi:hypothetical protein
MQSVFSRQRSTKREALVFVKFKGAVPPVGIRRKTVPTLCGRHGEKTRRVCTTTGDAVHTTKEIHAFIRLFGQ